MKTKTDGRWDGRRRSGGTAPWARASSSLRFVVITAALLAGLLPRGRGAQQVTLFLDEFEGPGSLSGWRASLPTGFLAATNQTAAYRGAPNFAFQLLGNNSVLRLNNVLNNWERVGWSSAAIFHSAKFRCEARFNTLNQSPLTSIDSFIEIWILDAGNPSRYDLVCPHGRSFGSDRRFVAASSIDRLLSNEPLSYMNHTDYRLVIEAPASGNIRALLLSDDGTELAAHTFLHSGSAFESGFRIGLSQGMGLPGVPYPVDVAVDWIWLTGDAPQAHEVVITNITHLGDAVTLTWNAPAAPFIVESAFRLREDWRCVGSSAGVATNRTTVSTQNLPKSFYRLQLGLEVVRIPDPGLAGVLRQLTVPKRSPTNEVYDVELAGIQNLETPGCGITNLTGLEWCLALGRFVAPNNAIRDLSAMSSLQRLSALDLAANQITDVGPLSGLSALTELGLRNNQIAVITALGGLTNLTSLDLGQNRVQDVTALRRLTRLTGLSLDDNRLGDVSALSGLTNVALINLWNNQIHSYAALAGMKDLWWATLGYNPVSDLGPLSQLAKITDLNLSANSIADTRPLAGLTNIWWLSLWGNRVTNITSLAGMRGLSVCWLSYNQIGDIRPLAGLLNLVTLGLEGNRVTDLSPLLANAAAGGLGEGDTVGLSGNPLSQEAQNVQIPRLRQYGVNVTWP